MPFKSAALLYCAAVLSPLAATAQQRTTTPHPADPAAAAPAVKYESTFTGYVLFRDEKLAPWREVNDEAARVGGHLGIFSGAAGHGGHSAPGAATQVPNPNGKPATPAAPQMMHGGHQGMGR